VSQRQRTFRQNESESTAARDNRPSSSDDEGERGKNAIEKTTVHR